MHKGEEEEESSTEVSGLSLVKSNIEEKEREKLKEKTKKTERLKRHKKSVGGRLKIDAENHQLQNAHHRCCLSRRKRLCVLGVKKITTKNGFSAA
jgi:DNA invertase Pin-like site-specific DNA recombinase